MPSGRRPWSRRASASRRREPRGFVSAAICFFGRLDRGGLRLALHRVRERLREQEDGRARRAAPARPRRRGSRRASPSARGGSVRRVHRTAHPQRHSFRYGAACSFVQAHVCARPSSSDVSAASRARARSAAASITERWTSPSRASSNRGSASLPATRAHGLVEWATVVPRRCRRCTAAVLPDRREQRGNDVADVDEVAAVLSVAVDHRLLAARQPLEEDRDDAAFEPGVLPRAVDVREAECDVRRAVDAVPARRGTPRRTSSRCRTATAAGTAPPRSPASALAVARRRPRRRRSPARSRRREHVHGADDVDGRVVARPLHRRLHVRLRREVEDDVGSTENGSRMSCSSRRRRGVTFSRLPVAKLSTTVTSSPRASERVDEIRPDEARTACDDRPHGGRRLVPRCS